jgi:hypothetical protein
MRIGRASIPDPRCSLTLGYRFKVDPSPVQALPVLAMDPQAMAHADRPANRADMIGVDGPLSHGL